MSRRLIGLPVVVRSPLTGSAATAHADVFRTPSPGVAFGGEAPAVVANLMVVAPMSGARLRRYAPGGVGIMHDKGLVARF